MQITESLLISLVLLNDLFPLVEVNKLFKSISRVILELVI